MDSTAERVSPSKAPLCERSANTHLPTNSGSQASREKTDGEVELKAATTKSMEYHRHVLQEKLEEGKSKYVSLKYLHYVLVAQLLRSG